MTADCQAQPDCEYIVVGSGAGGGTVVAEADPEGIVANAMSHTGAALKPVLSRVPRFAALAAA